MENSKLRIETYTYKDVCIRSLNYNLELMSALKHDLDFPALSIHKWFKLDYDKLKNLT